MKSIQKLWQNIAPAGLQAYFRFLLEPQKSKELRIAVLNRYQETDMNTLSPEILEGLKFLKHNKFSAYPYYWTLKYENWIPAVFRDELNQCFYVLFDEKKMYFPKKCTEKEVVWIVRSIFKEQDEKSPHRYLTPDFELDDDTIIVDAGVAEGNFALSVVEKAKKLYIVECDHDWMEALRLTFAPWKDKVVFVEKYLSGEVTQDTVSIDSFLIPEANQKYFLKMDIEGFEQLALSGMKRLVSSGLPIKMDICTYHKTNDLAEIQEIVTGYGFNCQVSDSYILFYRSGDVPEFRKVLIRAGKEN
jgi:hypothetical protein